MRVADYVFKTLADKGIEHVFLVTGGGAMHLNDGVLKEKRLQPVCNHHEQASAIATEGYFRASGKMAVACVTSGPGGTNALTGVIGQWLDSIPVIYISGQVKFETTISAYPDLPLRQLGDQEINIIDIVKPITKYAKTITSPEDIRIEMEKAFYFAQEGRPGPVWLDIPLNVQAAPVDADSLAGYVPPKRIVSDYDEQIESLIEKFEKAEHPVLIAGHGIRLAGAVDEFIEMAESTRLPVVTTFNGFDIFPSDHELYMGRIGTLGNRCGNFVLQNADLVLSIGSRNNIRQVSYNWENFARNGELVVIDIDPAELEKKTLKPALAIQADAGDFIRRFMDKARGIFRGSNQWLQWCDQRRRSFPRVTVESKQRKDAVDPYYFSQILSRQAPADSVLVAGNGSACVCMFQSGECKRKQRLFWNSGCAAMGYGLPAAIGSCFSRSSLVICVTGDGSIQMNLQELQTVVHHKLNLKIFVLDNYGYSSIRQTQNNFFGELIGCDETSGVSFPDILKLAEAYGIATSEIENNSQISQTIERVINMSGPVLCRVKLAKDQIFSPKLSSRRLPDGSMVSAPLEDMYPFLDKDELARHMLVDVGVKA